MSRAKVVKAVKAPANAQEGARVAQARREMAVVKHRDISGPEVARAVGVSAETVRSWEAGESFPRKEKLAELADYLGVMPAWLQFGTEPKLAPPKPDVPVSGLAPDPAKGRGTTGKRAQRAQGA